MRRGLICQSSWNITWDPEFAWCHVCPALSVDLSSFESVNINVVIFALILLATTPPPTPKLDRSKAKHEGELDIPRADALRFAREGRTLRREKILSPVGTVVKVRIFREYCAPQPQEEEEEQAAAVGSPSSRGRGGGADGGAGAGAGAWVVELGGKRKTLVGLRAEAAPGAEPAGSTIFGRRSSGGGGGGGSRRPRALLLKTRDGGEERLLCDDQESFRMWLGVAAAIFPSTSSDT